MIVAVALISYLIGTTCAAADLKRFYLDTVDPLAICNDGSPAAYYYRAGEGLGSSRWIIRLQGGGWCWDINSCQDRQKYAPYWTSTSVCPPTLNDTQTILGVGHEGILSGDMTKNPHFYNANHVWLWYCSSDSHAGNKSADTSTGGWYFHGKNIVKALIHHLLHVQNPSMMNAKEVLLTGDSAGGVATISNVDFVHDLITAYLPTVYYRGFVDTGWFLDIPAFGNNQFTFRMLAQNLISHWNVMYNENCVKSMGTGQAWRCFHAQYAYPFIKTRVFYQEFQYDSANLALNGVNYPFNSSTLAYANAFQKDMITAMMDVPYAFIPNCLKHQVEDGIMFHSIVVDNVSLDDALWQWYQQTSDNPPPMRFVDTCTGVNCNPSCPPLATAEV